jgi:DNA-binding MarR family transcriptional regulator
MMEDVTYTKGLYTATATVRQVDGDLYQGIVSLSRDEGDETEDTVYEVEATSATPEEALEEAKALAHRILGEIEL